MMGAYYTNLYYIILLPIMKLIAIALIALLGACAEKPNPLPTKPPAQFLWMTVPGTLEDAERMGFVCQPTPDGVAFRCRLSGVNVLGVSVDAALTVWSEKYGGKYNSIELLARKPSALEIRCSYPDDVDIDIVMLDGSSKRKGTEPCVKDKLKELESALAKNGWESTPHKRYISYTNHDYRIAVARDFDSETFVISRAE